MAQGGGGGGGCKLWGLHDERWDCWENNAQYENMKMGLYLIISNNV